MQMMKRSLLVVVLVLIGTSAAFAELSSSDDLVEMGNVAVLGTSTTSVTVSSDDALGDDLDHFDISGTGCPGVVTVIPTPPDDFRLITPITPMSVDVAFDPLARGPVTCTVSFRDSTNTSIGTDFVVTGTGVAPEINAPATADLGSVRVDNAVTLATTLNIQVGSVGDSDLVISDISIGGTNAADFVISSAVPPPNITVAPSDTTTITVHFNPSAAGTRTATLDITSNDPLTPIATIDLTGVGTNAQIAVTDEAFGVVDVGSNATQQIEVTNDAAADPGDLRITAATISGGDGWFTFESNGGDCTATDCDFGTPGLLAPQQIGVRCTPPSPDATGSRTADVIFTSDTDPTGADSTATLTCTAGRADAAVDPVSHDFLTVQVTQTAQREFTVTNSGNIPLTFTATRVNGARIGEYSLSGCATNCVVAANGGSETFTLTFAPTLRSADSGDAAIDIQIASDDPDDPTILVPIDAVSVAPVITPSAATVQFGNVEVLVTAGGSLSVQNTGDAPLEITTANFGTNDGSYAIANGSTGAQTVGAGASASWDLECTPGVQGAHDGTFVIASNALNATPPNNGTTTIQLRCTGTEGILVVDPTTLDFQGVPEDTTATLSFTLDNTGNLTVSNIAASIDNAFYTIDPTTPVPTSMAPGDPPVTINVIFAPLAEGDGGPGTLTITGTWGVTSKPLRANPTVALDGIGLRTGFDTTVDTLDFGDIRFDQFRDLTFCIENTGASPVTINSLSIAPNGVTQSNEFTVRPSITQVRRKAACTAGTGTLQTLPQSLAATNDVLEVTVRADPNNRIGAMSATLTVTSNLPVNPTSTVALAANSTSATLALAPGSTVDFGTLDIQASPATTDIVITNNGNAPLDLDNFARSDNGTNTHFSFTLPAGVQTLQPTQSLTIPVTYTPTAVTLPDEQITLTHTIAGDIDSPTAAAIIIRGKGIDREIDVAASPAFPDTFRNPGADAPVRPVTVTNTGEATLRITATMISSADPAVWTLVDASPQDIPGGGSFDFLVRFAPTSIGSAPAGTLTLTSDDSSEPTAVVTFSGNGIDRNVSFGAPRINLGFTGVGVPVRISDVLAVASMNTTTEFRLASIDVSDADPACIESGMVSDPGVFTIIDPPAGEALAESEQRLFDMTFSSNEPGRFVASARLFLDADPVPQATVCLEGTAVFVDARGGGGCATGGDIDGGALLLIAIAIVVMRRRRVLVASTLVIAIGSPVQAEKVVLSIFDPTPATTGMTFQLQNANVGAHGLWTLSTIVSHATDPLVLDASADGQARVIQRSTQVVVGGAFAFLDRFEVGAHLPLYVQDGAAAGDPSMMFTADPASGTAMGDLTMHGKVRVWKRGGAVVSGAAQLTLPTADAESFTGTEKPSLRVLGLATLVPDTLERRITLTGHLGGIARAKSRFANLEQGSGLTWGLGFSVRALDRMWFAAEMFGDLLPSARKESAMDGATALSPTEWLAGIRFLPTDQLNVGVAMGRGLTAAAGSPALRLIAGFSYTPRATELGPIKVLPPPKPDGDSDGDGLRDSADRCPNEPEDADLFDDGDGCPDLDNDNDKIVDASDKCPLDAEDYDKFEDEDGCPDKDNDKDDIADAQDKCPNEAEDKDGFGDLDGCPDLDNDKDGVADGKDKCVNEPETINGNKDDDGCPDVGDSVIVLSPDRIETLEGITFLPGNKIAITKSSFNVLGQVAATMRAHPEIIRLRVTSHVHPSGNYDKDQELSDKRAQIVRDWLVQWGLTSTRVEARGFGSSKTLAQPGQKGSAAINDRIELIILERK